MKTKCQYKQCLIFFRNLTVDRNIEFEVIPDSVGEDDTDMRGTSAESCFDFEAMKQHINLDVIEIGDDFEGCEDGSPFDKFRRKMHNLTEDGKVMKFVSVRFHRETKLMIIVIKSDSYSLLKKSVL